MRAATAPTIAMPWRAQAELVKHPEATPSARVLSDLRAEKMPFFPYALRCAEQARDYFAALAPLSDDRMQLFSQEAQDSLERQRAIEASDQQSFSEYLATYFAS